MIVPCSYLRELLHKFKAEGTEALVDKRWGAAPRKRTTEEEAAVLRTKALHPQRSDGELGQEFGMDRSTVYLLLKEHGLQDLHQVIAGNEAPVAEPEEDEKKDRNHTL